MGLSTSFVTYDYGRPAASPGFIRSSDLIVFPTAACSCSNCVRARISACWKQLSSNSSLMRCESDPSGWPCALPGSRCGAGLDGGPLASVEPGERSAPSRFSRTRASASGCSFPVRNPELDGVQTGSFGGISSACAGRGMCTLAGRTSSPWEWSAAQPESRSALIPAANSGDRRCRARRTAMLTTAATLTRTLRTTNPPPRPDGPRPAQSALRSLEQG